MLSSFSCTRLTPLAAAPLGRGCGSCRTAAPGHAAAACAHRTGTCAQGEGIDKPFAVTLIHVAVVGYLSADVGSNVVIPEVGAGNQAED